MDEKAKARIAQLEAQVAELEQKLESQQSRVARRKYEVLELLQDGPKTIDEIADALDITNKNVSSILCQVKAMGHEIMTDSKHRKILWDA